jgi:glutathione S-transferase
MRWIVSGSRVHGRGQPQQPGGFLRTEIIGGHHPGGGQLSSRTTRPEFVAGAGLTLADITMGNSIHGGYAFPIERPDFKNLKTWFDRI